MVWGRVCGWGVSVGRAWLGLCTLAYYPVHPAGPRAPLDTRRIKKWGATEAVSIEGDRLSSRDSGHTGTIRSGSTTGTVIGVRVSRASLGQLPGRLSACRRAP